MQLTIDHVGYLVRQLEKAKQLFADMGYKAVSDTIIDTFRDIDILFMEKDGYRIELVAPRSKESPIATLRKRTGSAPYHICYLVDDLGTAITELEKDHYIVSQEPHEAIAFQNRRVAFLIHSEMGIVELVEAEK